MKTIDDIVIELKNLGLHSLHPSIPARDQKILKNIASLMSTSSYITESQGNLLIKILRENLEYLDNSFLDISNAIKFPAWNKEFRVTEKIRKVSIEEREKGKFFIKIEYNFDKEIKKTISFLNKTIGQDGFYGSTKNQLYALTEKNLVIIYESLIPLKFSFSLDFLDLYKKIKSINLTDYISKFEFENFLSEKKNLLDGLNNDMPDLIKLDRKIKFQYNFTKDFDQEVKDALEYKIANRSIPKIYLASNTYRFEKVVRSIHALNREKILLVFDDYKISECIYHLNLLKDFVVRNNFSNSTGIYFRFDNKDDGLTFNKVIAEYKLNNHLNDNTKFAGINNGKLPKFMLKNDWYPDAVISFTNALRSNRTEVYCNDCDLVVYYTPVKPLSIKCDEIL